MTFLSVYMLSLQELDEGEYDVAMNDTGDWKETRSSSLVGT